MRELALKLARVHPALEARMKRWTEREWSGARNFLARRGCVDGPFLQLAKR